MHVRGEGGPPVLASVYTRVMLRAQVRVYGRLDLNSFTLLVDINEYLSVNRIPPGIYMCNVWVYFRRTPSCLLWI